jgi:hypothetical protein
MCGVGLAAALVLAIAAPAAGQSLADAARREAQRRSQVKAPTKIYTNADLDGAPFLRGMPVTLAPPDRAPAAAEAPADAQAEAAGTPEPPAAPGAAAEVRVKRDEEHWRERAGVIRGRLNRLQSDAVAMEGRVAALQTQLDSAEPAQAAALNSELQETTQALARVKRDLGLIQDEWRQFEDRAREAKIPPGWIR